VWPVSRGCLLLRGTWSCLWFSRVPCKPDFYSGLFHLPDLCTDLDSGLSVYLAWLTDFDCGLFRLPNFDTLNLTTDNWNGAHGGCDRSAEDVYSFVAPDPTFAFVEDPCCPKLDFVISFDYDYVLHIANFTILYYKHKFTRDTEITINISLHVAYIQWYTSVYTWGIDNNKRQSTHDTQTIINISLQLRNSQYQVSFYTWHTYTN
jgi:hypothetical protein